MAAYSHIWYRSREKGHPSLKERADPVFLGNLTCLQLWLHLGRVTGSFVPRVTVMVGGTGGVPSDRWAWLPNAKSLYFYGYKSLFSSGASSHLHLRTFSLVFFLSLLL